MLSNGTVLDTAYVIYDPKCDDYITANVGLFKTQRNAQKLCDRYNRNVVGRNWIVVKVNLVVTNE